MASERKVRNLDDLPLLMTAAEVAEVLDVTERTVWNYKKRGVIPAVRYGNRTRFSRDFIRTLMEQGSGRHSDD